MILERMCNTHISLVMRVPLYANKAGEYNSFAPRYWNGLLFFTEGETKYYFDDKEYICKPNTFVFLPKGRPYRTVQTNGCCYLINFHTPSDLGSEPFFGVFENSSMILDCFLKALNVFQKKQIGYKAELTSIIYHIIGLVQAGNHKGYLPTKHHALIDPAVEYIGRYYLEKDITVSELARLCGISAKYFTKLFSTYYNFTPKQYVINLKLDYARRLLLSEPDMTVQQISEKCHFSNVCYFSRLFSEHVGRPPSEYRKNL